MDNRKGFRRYKENTKFVNHKRQKIVETHHRHRRDWKLQIKKKLSGSLRYAACNDSRNYDLILRIADLYYNFLVCVIY